MGRAGLSVAAQRPRRDRIGAQLKRPPIYRGLIAKLLPHFPDNFDPSLNLS